MIDNNGQKRDITMEEVYALLNDLQKNAPQELEKLREKAAAARPTEEQHTNDDSLLTEERFRKAYTADTFVTDTMPETVDEEDIDYINFPLILPLDEDEYEDEDEDIPHPRAVARQTAAEAPREENDLAIDAPPPPPRQHRNPLAAFGEAFSANFFRKGDAVSELVRKSIFWLSLCVLIGSLCYIAYTLCVVPGINANRYDAVEEMYDPQDTDVVRNEGKYPEGMLASFRTLYDINDDVRGWLLYQSTGKKRFLNINYPVMYSGDNDKYLKQDFYEKKNKNGALFFDERNTIESEFDSNKVTIIYGHNMASGQMLAGLNKLIGSLERARAAATMTMSTLFRRQEYKVFAVLLIDEDDTSGWYFDYRRTSFSSAEDFMGFVDGLRQRSMFNYPVDVTSDDELLVLSTCTSYSTSKLHNGRLAVVARRVRDGESAMVMTDYITRNANAIMPRAWYTNQNQDLPAYYGGSGNTVPGTSTTGGYSDSTTAGTYPTGTTDEGAVTWWDPAGTTPTGQMPIVTDGNGSTITAPSGTAATGTAAPSTGTTAHTKPGETTKPTPPPTAGTGTSVTAKPTDPTGLTEPSTNPTEPANPTEPSTEPTEPTEPSTEPTEPTEPTTEPTDPTDPTSDPGGEPSEPGNDE